MFRYRIYGLQVESDLELQEAELSTDTAEVDVRIFQGDISEEERERIKKNGMMYVKRQEAGADIPGAAVFYLENGKSVKYALYQPCDMKRVHEFLLGDGMGFLMFQQQKLTIHGSGICWKGKTLAITGRSGAGKSTLTMELRRRGAEFMADDTVAIDYVGGVTVAKPGYPQQKLCRDAALAFGYKIGELIPLSGERDKYAVRLHGEYHNQEEHLNALVMLQKDEHITEPFIERIDGSMKLQYLMWSSYVYKLYEALKATPKEMQTYINIANDIQIFVIHRPAEGLTVDRQVELLEQML